MAKFEDINTPCIYTIFKYYCPICGGFRVYIFGIIRICAHDGTNWDELEGEVMEEKQNAIS